MDNLSLKRDQSKFESLAEDLKTGHKIGFDPLKDGQHELAKKHRKAQKVRDLNNPRGVKETCECCGMPVDAPRYALCSTLAALNDLGPGFPMYYLNVKYIFLVLALGITIVGLPCLISNIEEDNSEEWEEDAPWPVDVSVGAQGSENTLPEWQVILNIVFMALTLISYHLWMRKLAKTEEEIDMRVITPSDYTVMVTGLPKDTNEEEVKSFFEKNGRVDGRPANVIKVNFAYKIKSYIEDIRTQVKLIEELKYIEHYQEEHPNELPKKTVFFCFSKAMESPVKIQKNLQKVQKRIEKFETETEAGVGRDLLIGTAFVTFETQAEARAVEARYGKRTILWAWEVFFNMVFKKCIKHKEGHSYFFRGQSIHANIAPEPSDIFWENLEVSVKGRLQNTLITYLVTLIALGASFGMIFGCSYFQDSMNDEIRDTEGNASTAEEWELRINSIWPALMVVIINFFLGRAIRKFTMHEKHHTYTITNSSVAFKLTVSQFLNTAVIALIVNNDYETNWFVAGGLVVDMTYILISNAFFQPLFYVFSPAFCIKRLKMRAAVKNPKIKQAELNAMYEPPEIDMAQRYANLMKTVLVTFCYAPIIPLGLVISLVGVLLQYWVEKWTLLSRHKRPNRLSGDLATTIIGIVPWAVLLYSIMNYYYALMLNDEASNTAGIWMFIVISYIFLPIEFLFACFKKTNIDVFEEMYAGDKYNKVASDFYDDYDRENPVTSNEGWEWYLKLKEENDPTWITENPSFNEMMLNIRGLGVANRLQNYARGRVSLREIGNRQEAALTGLVIGRVNNNQRNDLNMMKKMIIGNKQIQNTYALPTYQQNSFAAFGRAITGISNKDRTQVMPFAHPDLEHKEEAKKMNVDSSHNATPAHSALNNYTNYSMNADLKNNKESLFVFKPIPDEDLKVNSEERNSQQHHPASTSQPVSMEHSVPPENSLSNPAIFPHQNPDSRLYPSPQQSANISSHHGNLDSSAAISNDPNALPEDENS